MQTASTAALAGWMMALLAGSAPAYGQRLLELEPRTSAGTEAVVRGAAAVFWNPGAVAGLERRAEATVVDVRPPESTGLGGLAVAAALRLDEATTIALGYQHVGIDGIERTSQSPLPGDAEGVIDLAENVISAGAARAIGENLVVGGAVHYTRAADLEEIDDGVEASAGVDYRPAVVMAPRIGAAARFDADRLGWLAGIEVAPLADRVRGWTVTASYGAAGGGSRRGVGHRFAGGVRWDERVGISAGVVGDADGDGLAWAPIAAAELRLSRYLLGVLRESLPNDFGAVYALRFTVHF